MVAVIGIGGYLGHDSGAALLVDGKIVAATQEERFTGNKHEKEFPVHSIAYCLKVGGLGNSEITHLAFTEKPYTVRTFNSGGYLFSKVGEVIDSLGLLQWASPFHQKAFELFPHAKGVAVEHHQTHIAPSFLLSGYSDAAFICLDGKGENYCATYGTVSPEGIETIGRHQFENGLGMLYTIVTHFLGFLSFGDEYKVMGLAPYGEPAYIDEIASLYQTDDAGHLRLKSAHSWMRLDGNLELQNAVGFPMRNPEDPIEQKHKNMAASIQKVFEDEILKLTRHVKNLCGTQSNLIFTGGCAQNCVAGGRLSRSEIFDSVFVSPVASDMSSSLGAVVSVSSVLKMEVDSESFRSLYLGPEPEEPPSESTPWEVKFEGDLHSFIATQLSEGCCVAWVRGRMEFGPRALGARSILADPRDPDAREKLNSKIKFRESFRPFGPAILKEQVSEWFSLHGNADYMNLTGQILEDHSRGTPKIPSVVHVDSSSRIQTVDKAIHGDFHQLISEFEKLSGVPILINTSFNLAGAPIVCTAEGAWNTFIATDLDLLVIGDKVFRQPQPKKGTTYS